MTMTRKDFETMSTAFRKVPDSFRTTEWNCAVSTVAVVAYQNNPRFDFHKFFDACGMNEAAKSIAIMSAEIDLDIEI